MNHSVFVIYKDGSPLFPNKNSGVTKAAYVTKGTARAVVTNLANDYVRYSKDLYRYENPEKYDSELAKEKERYEIVEYVPKGSV